MVLTYHPLNERIKRILLRNFNILSGDPETREVFSQLPLVAYRRDSSLHDILLRNSDSNQVNSHGVHLLAYTLAVAPASKFPATPKCVALNALLLTRRSFLTKNLA